MKWKFNEIDQSPELSSDLEWMIQSGQVSRELLLEKLAEAYYASVYRLALSLTGDISATRTIAREVFNYLVFNPHRYREQAKVDIWVHQNAYLIIKRTRRRERFWHGIEWWIASPGQFTSPLTVEPKDELDRTLWRKLDQLEDGLRTALILRYGMGWETPYIHRITGTGEDVIGRRIENGLRELTNKTALPREGLASKLNASLQTRYPTPEADEALKFANQLNEHTRRRFMLRGSLATVREMMLVGLAILLVLLAIWGGNRYIFGGELLPLSFESQDTRPQADGSSLGSPQQSQTATPTATPENQREGIAPDSGDPIFTSTPTGVFYYAEQGDTLSSIASDLEVSEDELKKLNRLPDNFRIVAGLPMFIPGSHPTSIPLRATPVTPISRPRVPAPPATSADVISLLNPNELPYHSLWVSAVISTHGPSNPDTASNVSQIQFWISQSQFLLLGGGLGLEPQEVGIGMGGRAYLARPGHGQPWFQGVYSNNPFLDSTLLYGLYLLFGEIGDLATSEFVLLGMSKIAERDVWVISQLDSNRERIGMLYLDEQTGFILRYRRMGTPEFSSGAGMFLPDEVEVTAVEYDIDIPQDLFDISLPWRGGYAADHTGQPAPQHGTVFEQPDISLDFDDRKNDLPEGYDPSMGRLDFRFPIGRYKILSMAGTDIYADGYFLGRVDMGSPWNVTCQRSSNGQIIVYRTATSNKDDLISLSNGPYYLRLDPPLEIRRVLPGASRASEDFAISPDSQYVAVWACERNSDPCGVYLHDLENHTWRRLIDIPEEAGGFAWSPQGDQLAMQTASNIFMVVDTSDGGLLYSSENESTSLTPPPDMRSVFIEGETTTRPQGLEACVNPP